ncbi:MAG: MAPEG family protein [Polyangiaceae bacterium]|jgi:uncharacterized MAPEG superfamily protein
MTIPILCIAVAYLLVYLPHFAAGSQRFKMAGGFDNHYPRDQAARLQGWAKRASAAHQNGFETFAPFAIGVLVSWVGHGNEHTLSLLACAFVALRVIYIGLYVADVAALRSVVWTTGMLVTFALYLLPLFS